MNELSVALNSAGHKTLSVFVEGNVDQMSSLVPCAYPPYPDFLAPEFTPLRYLRLKNTGSLPVAAPRVLSSATSGTAWSIHDVAHEIVAGLTEDSHRIRAVEAFIGQRFRFGQDPEYATDDAAVAEGMAGAWPFYEGYGTTRGVETYGLLRQLHCYGSGNCVTAGLLFNALCGELGYRTRIVHIRDHFVCEVHHNGQWRMYDPLCRGMALRGGLSQSVADISRNPALFRTMRWHFPANYERIRHDDTYDNRPSALDGRVDPETGLFSQHVPHETGMPSQEAALDLTLHPGDSLEWKSSFEGLFHTWIVPNQYNWIRPPHRCANGVFRRTLPLAHGCGRTEVTLPYPILGGRVLCARRVRGKVASSPAGAFQELSFRPAGGNMVAWLDQAIQPLQAPAVHHVAFEFHCEQPAEGQDEVTVELFFQHNPDALPALSCGENTLRLEALSPSFQVELTLGWEARQCPVTATPSVVGLSVDAEGILVGECSSLAEAELYHFQIADGQTPFLPAVAYSFERITRRPKARFAGVGLLEAGRYCARVRAKAVDGIWSAWSAPHMFLRTPDQTVTSEG